MILQSHAKLGHIHTMYGYGDILLYITHVVIYAHKTNEKSNKKEKHTHTLRHVRLNEGAHMHIHAHALVNTYRICISKADRQGKAVTLLECLHKFLTLLPLCFALRVSLILHFLWFHFAMCIVFRHFCHVRAGMERGKQGRILLGIMFNGILGLVYIYSYMTEGHQGLKMTQCGEDLHIHEFDN